MVLGPELVVAVRAEEVKRIVALTVTFWNRFLRGLFRGHTWRSAAISGRLKDAKVGSFGNSSHVNVSEETRSSVRKTFC
jgi:hypothetical protein